MTDHDDLSPDLPAAPASPVAARLDLATVRERLAASGGGPRYWRSLEELAETPDFEEFLHREFPRQASEWPEGVDRRRFLTLSAATLALGGLAACTRQPAESIVPYVRQPEDVVPGRPLFYATALTHGGYAQGLLVESHEGRPTKVEGNPGHPASLGATDAFSQAAILSLYDPDRSQTFAKMGEIRSWEIFCDELDEALRAQAALGGSGLRILTQTITSPTLEEQLAAVTAKYPKAKWIAWEPAGRHTERAAALAAFGRPVETRYDLSKADVVLTLDGDLLTEGPGALRYARQFAERRRVKEEGAAPARLYSVESIPTCTGTLADHRLPLSPARVAAFARALAAELGVAPAGKTPAAGDRRTGRFLAAAVKDLKGAAGRCLVAAGPACAPEVHVLVHAINAALGAVGTTVFASAPVEVQPADQPAALAALVAEMRAGTVDVLLILGGNPVFDAPADLGFSAAMEKVPFRAHLSLHADETSEYCQWQLPEAHGLESWSDARAFDGTASILQPLILPLYGGKSPHELLAALLGDRKASGYDLVRATWKKRMAGDFEPAWRRALNDGVLPNTAIPTAAASLLPGAAAKAAAAVDAAKDAGFELALRPDPTIHDGRHANNGWLQELPKPITKLTWDTALHLSPATASRLGFVNGDVVTLKAGGRQVEAPVFLLPGHADDCGTLYFGYGRRRAGRVGTGTGFDAYPLRTRAALWNLPGVAVAKAGREYPLVTTQHQFSIEGRNVYRAGTLPVFREDPEFAKKLGEAPPAEMTLYPPHPYDGYKWGLSIDLSTCTGCSACVVACQAENNIPVVGKDQVSRGRAMHWLRIDRYFEGDPNDPALVTQPVACMQCENAPCEVVCPVAATTHSDEGLNVMTYNRCVGTKYCSNNCPYKVRRFNFFQYSDVSTPVKKMMANPDVTVRNRGVMEKCTYCVQRINRARIAAEIDDRAIRDGEIRTACQQACPTEAIVFGNMNDKTARVTALKGNPLSYGMLEDLNTRPRTSYLARVTNPNPELAGGAALPHPLAGERS